MKNKGFTLVELMVVIVIIGILAAIAIPRFREEMRKQQQSHNVQWLSNKGKTILSTLTVHDTIIVHDTVYINRNNDWSK